MSPNVPKPNGTTNNDKATAPHVCTVSVLLSRTLNFSSRTRTQATVGGGGGGGGGGATSEDGAGTKLNDDNEGNIHQQTGEDVFFVDGTGRVTAGGGLETGPIGNLVAKGGLVSEGSTVLERKRAIRGGADPGASGQGGDKGGRVWNTEGGEGDEVEVDANLGTFFEVPDDGREGSANVLRIKVWACCGCASAFGPLTAQQGCFW